MTGEREALWEKRCVFCPIIAGDAPATFVERGERHAAFVPMGPHVPGHVLFVPTEHLPDATVNPARTGDIVAEASRYVAEHRMDANIVTSAGTAATQSVPHLHVHVIPRGDDDGLPGRWPWIPEPTPAPVTGETTDAGVGETTSPHERLLTHCLGPLAPAEPDAGDDVEALTEALYADGDLGPGYMMRDDCEHLARRFLASPWLAADRRKAGDDRAERLRDALIAQLCDCGDFDGHPGDCAATPVINVAARIARETR